MNRNSSRRNAITLPRLNRTDNAVSVMMRSPSVIRPPVPIEPIAPPEILTPRNMSQNNQVAEPNPTNSQEQLPFPLHDITGPRR